MDASSGPFTCADTQGRNVNQYVGADTTGALGFSLARSTAVSGF
ncbi:MAG: hypothetical protein AAGH83_00405 [Pseudomonadota bacterium]